MTPRVWLYYTYVIKLNKDIIVYIRKRIDKYTHCSISPRFFLSIIIYNFTKERKIKTGLYK
jgi:hypothetical protein